MQSRDRKYFSRSWSAMTHEKGWVTTLILGALAIFVPIVGPLGVKGYALEWARNTAWGIDSSPRQTKTKIGKCIGTGWRAFVVDIVLIIAWFVICIILYRILSSFIADRFAHAFINFYDVVFIIASLFVGMIFTVAELRATIYTSIYAGLEPMRLWDMVKRDARGLFKIIFIPLAFCVLFIILAFVSITVLYVLLSQYTYELTYIFAAEQYGFATSNMVFRFFDIVLSVGTPVLLISLFILSLLAMAYNVLMYNAVGFWTSQFNVPAWGSVSDPLPENILLSSFEVSETSEPVTAAAQDTNGSNPASSSAGSVSTDMQQSTPIEMSEAHQDVQQQPSTYPRQKIIENDQTSLLRSTSPSDSSTLTSE